mgnify:CR=1 FL=1
MILNYIEKAYYINLDKRTEKNIDVLESKKTHR